MDAHGFGGTVVAVAAALQCIVANAGPVVGNDAADRVALHYQHLRWNRASGDWDVQLILSNRTDFRLEDICRIRWDTDNPRGAMFRRDPRGCRGEPMSHLEWHFDSPEAALAPGQCTPPVLLSLAGDMVPGTEPFPLVARITIGSCRAGEVDNPGEPAIAEANTPDVQDGAWTALLAGGSGGAALPVLVTNILQTGTGLPLATVALPVVIPDTLPRPSLSFLFGFGTDESVTSGTFLDAFSITVQTVDESATALLLTADASGVVWAPPNPGGIVLSDGRIVRAPIAFPDLGRHFARERAFTTSYAVSPELAGRDAVVYLDLFDNQNTQASLAFLIGLDLRPGFLEISSSSVPEGPYGRETAARFDRRAQTVSLPLVPDHRFFRLASDQGVRMTSLSHGGSSWLIQYQFLNGPATAPPRVLSSASVEGGYAEESGVVAEPALSILRVPQKPGARFYRLRSEIPLRITGMMVRDERLIMTYAEP